MLRLLIETGSLFPEVFEDVLALRSQFVESLQVGQLARELQVELDVALELPPRLQRGLRFLLAGPELRVCSLLLQLRYFRLLVFCVKDNLGSG